MRIAIATALLGVATLTASAAAQTQPAAPTIARTVVAGREAALPRRLFYFRVVSVSIPPAKRSASRGAQTASSTSYPDRPKSPPPRLRPSRAVGAC